MRFWVAIFLTVTLGWGGSPARVEGTVQFSQEEFFQGYDLVQQWRLKEAEVKAQNLLEKFPQSGDAHFLHAQVEFFKGNYPFAWKILQRVAAEQGQVREFMQLVDETRQTTAGFVSQESEHFVFRYAPGADEILLHFARDTLEKSYQVLGDILGFHPQDKVIVEFYPDRQSLARISPLTLQDIVTSGTVALCKYNRIMMISPASLVRGFDWLDTLSHEYVHYLLTKKSRNTLPLWMHEGIAKMLESRWRGEKKYLTPLMETILADGLAQDYLVSLDRMMPSFAKLETAEDVQLAYAEVSTMVEYLTETQGEPALATLLEDLASGVPFEKALGEGVGTDLPTFQENWKRYMKTQKELKSIPGLRVLKIRFKKDRSLEEQEKDYREVGSRRAQDLTFLGDILKSRNEYKAALLEYEKAFEANKTENPILYNKLAGTYMVTQEYDRAETLLTRSLRYYPTFHTTLVNLGELYLQTGRTQPARDSFEKALRINPFNPIVHERLIQIYDRLQMPEQKKTQENLYGYLQ